MRFTYCIATVLLAGLAGGCSRRQPAEEIPDTSPVAAREAAVATDSMEARAVTSAAGGTVTVTPTSVPGAAQPLVEDRSTTNGAPGVAPVVRSDERTRISSADRGGTDFDPRDDDPHRIALRRSQTAPTNMRPPRLKAPPVRPTE
jgi:hypothetical protein